MYQLLVFTLSFLIIVLNAMPVAFGSTVVSLPKSIAQAPLKINCTQPQLRGMVFYPKNPLRMDFILDQNQEGVQEQVLREHAQRMVEYFMASLTTPEQDIWVNLSPYEKERMISSHLAQTFMGQDLLAQDYQLKQMMASSINPQKALGRAFWDQVYIKAKQSFNTTRIPLSTFNKVWIVPNEAVIYRNKTTNTVLVVKSSLKVMLENDYLATYKSKTVIRPFERKYSESVEAEQLSQNIARQILIPAIEKEVNEGRNFEVLRQIYHALILSKWYKQNIRSNAIADVYVNKHKMTGIQSGDAQQNALLYEQYVRSYRKGAFNFIQEEFDESARKIVPRKYFSGGFTTSAFEIEEVDSSMLGSFVSNIKRFGFPLLVSIMFQAAGSDAGAQSRTSEVLNAISPTQSTPLQATTEQIESWLTVIAQAENGAGDPKAAANAFLRVGYHPQALQSASRMVRMYQAGSLREAVRNSLDSGTGPGAQLTLTGAARGLGPLGIPLQLTASGIIETGIVIGQMVLENMNVGDITLMNAALRYLYINADKISESDLIDRVSGRGVWESVIDGIGKSSDSEKVWRLAVLERLIGSNRASRELIRTKAIKGMDAVYASLDSSNVMVQIAALGVISAIPTDDRDNRYQRKVEDIINKHAQKTGEQNLIVMAMMSKLAERFNISAIPALVKSIIEIGKNRPLALDIVQLRNWDEQVRPLVSSIVALSGTSPEVLKTNLKITTGWLTSTRSDDAVNTYLWLLFIAAQNNQLSKEAYVNALNEMRQRNRLSAVSGADIKILPAGDIGASLGDLVQGIDVEKNAERLVGMGGPMYTLILLDVLEKTDDSDILEAILSQMRFALANTVVGREKLSSIIKAKLSSSPSGVKDAVLNFIIQNQNIVSNDVLERAFVDAPLSLSIDLLSRMAQSGQKVSQGVIRRATALALAQENPQANQLNVGGANQQYARILSATVQLAHNAQLSDYPGMVQREAGGDPKKVLTAQALINMYKSVRPTVNERRPPVAANTQRGQTATGVSRSREQVVVASTTTGAAGAFNAERAAREYLRLTGQGDSEKVKNSLAAAYNMFRSLSDQNSGEAILKGLITDNEFKNPEGLKKLASLAGGLEFGYGSLTSMLGSGYVQVDQHILGLIEAKPKASAARDLVRGLMAWVDYRQKELGSNLASMDSFDAVYPAYVKAAQKVGALALNAASRVHAANPYEQLVLADFLKSIDSPGDRDQVVKYNGFIRKAMSPQSSEQEVVQAVSEIAKLETLPVWSFSDTLKLMEKTQRFGGSRNIKVALGSVNAAIEQKISRDAVAAILYEEKKDKLVKEFDATRQPEAMVGIATAIISLPTGYAAEGFLSAILSLESKFAQDAQGWQAFSSTVLTMRNMINSASAEIQSAIVQKLKNDLNERLATNARYEHPLVAAMVASLDEATLKIMNDGFKSSEVEHLRQPPDSSWATYYDLDKKARSMYLRVAGILNGSRHKEIPSGLSVDVLAKSTILMSPYQSDFWINASKSLPWFVMAILPKQDMPTIEAQVISLYIQQSIQLSTNAIVQDLRVEGKDYFKMPPEVQVVYAGLLTKSNILKAQEQISEILKDPKDLIEKNPAALIELVNGIAASGADRVRQLALLGNGHMGLIHNDMLGDVIEKALTVLANRLGGTRVATIIRSVADEIAASENLPQRYPQQLRVLASKIDKSMVTEGGIDMKDISIKEEGDVEIFDGMDQAEIWEMLRQAEGLRVDVQGIKVLNQPLIHHLVGINL